MNSRLGLLSALLLVQLSMVFVALLAPIGRQNEPSQLVVFDTTEVDRLTISDAQTAVELTRDKRNWSVSAVPADVGKVNDFLGKLVNINAPWPVASSRDSAERFEVSEENFQRRIRVYRSDNLVADLYLGTSPGYQQVHARRADQDEVYSVGLSNYEISVDPDSWLDKSVLAFPEVPSGIELRLLSDSTESTAVETGTPQSLSLGDNGWLYNDKAADQEAAAMYANRFTTLRVLGLADASLASIERGRIMLRDGSGERTLIISQQLDAGDYLIASTDTGPRYRVATYIAEQLLMSDADFLATENKNQDLP